MKLILSLCGRHRKIAHSRAVRNIKVSAPILTNAPTFSLGLIYPVISRIGLLKPLLILVYIINKLPRIQLIVICSDHALIRQLVTINPRIRVLLSSKLINLFWNDWRELMPYLIVSESCYLAGGKACIVDMPSYKVAPIFPASYKRIKRSTDLQDKILFVGKVYYDVETIEREMVLNEPTDSFNTIRDKLFNIDSFSVLRGQETKFLNDIRGLNFEVEVLSAWATYRNLCRTLFLRELRDSELSDNTYVIGTRLKNDFGFNGEDDCYNWNRLRKHMLEAKVNLDLGSQLLVSSYYDRSCSILEVAPGSLLQLRQEDSVIAYGSLEQEHTFETMDQFQQLATQRFKMNSSMMSNADELTAQQINVRTNSTHMELHFD